MVRGFGQNLRSARLKRGLSQTELEDLSGVPKSRISRYENGRIDPSVETLRKLAKSLKVKASDLLGW